MRIVGYLLLLVLSAGLFIGLGIHGVWTQQQALYSFQPVNASVNRNTVRTSPMGGFEPDVLFTYRVGGKPYESDRAAPLRINGSREWVEVLSRRVLAEGTTAYVNPRDPGEAYLLPIGRFRPYGMIVFGIALLGLGLIPIRSGGVLSYEPVAITDGPYDWYDLIPSGSPSNQVMGWSTALLLWYALGVFVFAHYYLMLPAPYEWKPIISAALYACVGLWPTYRAVRAMGIASRLGAPKVQTTQRTAHLGEPIIVRIEQPFLRDTIVREIRVAITCTRRNGLNSVRYYTASFVAAQDRTVRAGERVQGEFTFDVPDKKRHPSTPFTRWDYPRTDWQIEVTTRTNKAGSTTSFPIIAENAHHTSAKAA